jgi:methionyl-tRNA formyltransferase
MPPRCGFVTCVRLGLSCMEAIDAEGGRLAAVMTIPDDRATRKSGRVWVDDFCSSRGLPLGKFRNINDPEAVSWLRAMELDWLFIIGWSQIARRDVLSSTRFGALGMHPTLLPEGRGRASIPWAIIKGLQRTGVTMFKLDEGVDTGPVAAQLEVPIDADETAGTLYGKIEAAHVALMRRAWRDLAVGDLRLTPQDESCATVWPGRVHDDGRLSAGMDVGDAARLIRATTRPYPGAFMDGVASRLRVWSAERSDSQGTGIALLAFRGGCLRVTDGGWEPLPAAAAGGPSSV